MQEIMNKHLEIRSRIKLQAISRHLRSETSITFNNLRSHMISVITINKPP